MGLPSMKYPRERGDMIETYKYIHGLYSVNSSLLKMDIETITRGHKYKLKNLDVAPACVNILSPSESWTAGTRCRLRLSTPHPCRLLRAAGLHLARQEISSGSVAHQRSDLNVES